MCCFCLSFHIIWDIIATQLLICWNLSKWLVRILIPLYLPFQLPIQEKNKRYLKLLSHNNQYQDWPFENDGRSSWDATSRSNVWLEWKHLNLMRIVSCYANSIEVFQLLCHCSVIVGILAFGLFIRRQMIITYARSGNGLTWYLLPCPDMM